MALKSRNRQSIAILSLILMLIMVVVFGFTPVQAVDSQLEFRIRSLERQVSQLQGEINRVRGQAGGVTRIEVEPPDNVPPEAAGRLISGDPMFDRPSYFSD
ncbi:MAG: hypothetical protein HC825_08435 [Oscillatoriales cyanobacterium RM1_1_9]|nr:hypothetical protein [Oscillatoriales cyanobacterium RM1_1_9]